MIHDVIHERYPRHGPAFYMERERLARERLAVLHPDNDTALGLVDDIAVGLHRRGRTDEATALVRDKLKRQQALNLDEKDLYSSYANLGEFLVQGNRMRMLGGDVTARKGVQEGLDFLTRSKRVNPNAHFAREEWQLVAVGAWLDDGALPERMRKCDLIGNRLDRPIEVPREPWLQGPGFDCEVAYGRPFGAEWTYSLHTRRIPNSFADGVLSNDERKKYREHVARVGGESPPGASPLGAPSGVRAPFDEPALWLIGEWRQGSGPNPHYALCLGEIMLRVGQRYLAWNCYERASRMADRFSPDRDEQAFLRYHCKSRQAAIEKSLPAKEVESLRSKFEAELAFGESYQRDYQTYEEERIRAGANLNDPHFYDEFQAGRPPIASKVGPEEWYAGTRPRIEYKLYAFVAWGVFTAGGLLLLAGLWARRGYARPRVSGTRITPPPSPAV
jgi:hypothetical protein